jgi:hypothetical protein
MMATTNDAYGLWDSNNAKSGGNFFTDFFGRKDKVGGAAAKKAKKAKKAKDAKKPKKETYKKTERTVVGRDGVSRTLYTKGQRRYVKKKNSEGKFVYREVKS